VKGSSKESWLQRGWPHAGETGRSCLGPQDERDFPAGGSSAKLCGACPIPAGSGKTNGRRRLNRGGNRKANAALYGAVIVRMRWHDPTIAYVTRRSAEGLSKNDIIRCLKRYLVREVYQLLPAATANTQALERVASIDLRPIGGAMPWPKRSTAPSRRSQSSSTDRGEPGQELETAIINWIYWYNETRLHGEIGDMPPTEYEQIWYAYHQPASTGT
jgi:transposase InsO family protein